jgi:hypothetical protein
MMLSILTRIPMTHNRAKRYLYWAYHDEEKMRIIMQIIACKRRSFYGAEY